jgi:hypothetical protein
MIVTTATPATTQNEMYQLGERARADFWRHNVLQLPAIPLFYSEDRFAQISQSCTDISYTHVKSGDSNDSHDVDCGRLLNALVGEPPKALHERAASILQKVCSASLIDYVKGILGISSDLFIRRAQAHIMMPGQFIGPHVDHFADPDLEIVVILYLNSEFSGGSHNIDFRDARGCRAYDVKAGDITIAPIDTWHWVAPVEQGRRHSLAVFFSRYNGPNRRSEMNPPVYSG